MKKVAFAVTALMTCLAAHAKVTTSIDGGTSYIHLGAFSKASCQALMASPVLAKVQVAVDGHVMPTGDVTCRDGVKVDLVATEPVMKTTPTEITTWPLAKSDCMVLAMKQLEKGPVRINGAAVSKTDQIEHACSKASNSVSVPL